MGLKVNRSGVSGGIEVLESKGEEKSPPSKTEDGAPAATKSTRK